MKSRVTYNRSKVGSSTTRLLVAVLRAPRILAALATLACAPLAHASLVWSKGSYDPATWTAGENILTNAVCDTSSLTALADGKIDVFSVVNNGNITNNQVVSWTLFRPSHIIGVNIYSRWKDSGRDGINVQKLEVKFSGSDTWDDIGASAVTQDANTGANYVSLSESSGGRLVLGAVTAFRITFGTQDNNKTCYPEIELISRETDVLFMVSFPDGIGEPTPSGDLPALAAGQTVAVSCGATPWTNATETAAYVCTGWKLYDIDDNLDSSGAETSFTYTHPNPAAYRRLEWQWSPSAVQGTVTASAGGTVSPSGTAWFSATPVTVTATPDAGKGFVRWTGTLPASVDANAASVTFTPTAPFEMEAVFCTMRDFYVAKDGDDGTGDGSQATPYATIAKAISEADAAIAGASADMATIHVAKGTYEESGLLITNAITIVGATGNPADVIISKNSANHVTLSHADAVLKDLTFEKGKSSASQVNASTALLGKGMVNISAGLIDHCIIRQSISQVNYHAQGLCMTGGRITRSVIRNNEVYGAAQYASIIYMNNAKMDNCLICNHSNAFQVDTSKYGTVYSGSGNTIVNCVFASNTPNAFNTQYGSDPAMVNCLFFVSTGRTTGTSNVVVGGTDTGEWGTYFDSNETYRPLASCTTVINGGSDAEYPAWASTIDLDGNPRKSGSAIDVGCYEMDLSSAIVAGVADIYAGQLGTTPTFTASASGGSGNYKFKWNFGDGSAEQITTSATITHTYAAAGLYAATVAVSDDDGASWGDAVALPSKVVIAPANIYVKEGNASASFPYDTDATAAATLADAYGCLTNTVSATLGQAIVDGVTIHVAAGNYTGSGYVLAGDIDIVGESADSTVVNGNGGYRVFTLSSSDASVKNLTIRNGRFSANSQSGAGVYMTAGLVEDCRIESCGDGATGAYTKTLTSGGGICASGGRVNRTVFAGCSVRAIDNNDGSGSAIYLSGGAVCENSLFTNNVAGAYNSNANKGGTVNLRGDGTALVNCTVVNNQNSGDGRAMAYTGIIQSGNAKVVNCVAYMNGSRTKSTTYRDVNGTASCFTNSVWDAANDGSIVSPVAIDATAFKDYANGDFRPAKDGVLVNAGTKWDAYLGYGATSEKDLAGAARLSGKFLDIGCYETATSAGLQIYVR